MPSPPAMPSLSIMPLTPATPINTVTPCLITHLAVYQIHRTANTVIKASTLSWRHWEHGYSSSGRACSHSLLRSEPTRKHCHSCSLKYESGSPSDWAEKCSHEAPQCPRWDKLEFFQSGTGPCGGACAVCLNHHKHNFSKCDGVKLWDGSVGSPRKNKQGRLVAANGLPICFDWQMPQGCASTSHSDRHRCSGCGKTNHGAQTCP